MTVSFRITGAVAALVIAVGGCADGPGAATAPVSSAAVPIATVNHKAMLASSSAISDEGSRLVAMVENGEQRAALSASLERLAYAMEMGDVLTARRALSDARGGLRFIQSDADRDALRLALDAADESFTSNFKQGVTR